MNIGDTLRINEIDLVILDFVDDNPLVWAYNVNTKSKFSNNSTDYRTSILRKTMESWFEDTGIQAIEREVDLTAMNGNDDYGKITTKVAPFTFDEYRKYNKIVERYVKDWFWTATAWSNKGWGSGRVCYVYSDGGASYSYYSYGYGLAPVFILDKTYMN